MPVRDVNGVGKALNQAASYGRGGDNRMAHVGTGEVVVPAEVIDNVPSVLPSLIKAFQKVGLPWRRYIVGGDENSKNPQTGAPEFYAEAGQGQDVRDRDAQQRDFDRSQRDTMGSQRDGRTMAPGGRSMGPTGFETSPEMGGRGTLETYGADMSRELGNLGGAGKVVGGIAGALGGLLGGAPYGGYKAGSSLGGKLGGMLEEDPYGRTPTGNLGPDTSQREGRETALPAPAPPTYAPPAVPEPPPGMFTDEMDDLQRRTMIATYGLNSSDVRYQTSPMEEYYKALAANAVASGEDLTPIEQQYIEQVLGIDIPGDDQELLRLLGGTQASSGTGLFPNSGDVLRGSRTSGLVGL